LRFANCLTQQSITLSWEEKYAARIIGHFGVSVLFSVPNVETRTTASHWKCRELAYVLQKMCRNVSGCYEHRRGVKPALFTRKCQISLCSDAALSLNKSVRARLMTPGPRSGPWQQRTTQFRPSNQHHSQVSRTL